MLSGADRTLAWTSFNKPASIANNTISFSYDGDFERYKEVETTCTDYLGNTQTTCIKYMVNARPDTGIHYEKEINGSITTYRNFLYAGPGNIVGVYTTRSDSSTQLAYFGKDHLGSVVLSTGATGNLIERLSYDPFGKRRNLIGTDDPSDILRSAVTHQGLSMHEMLDDGGMGLIDMNARIYDPLLGRFMSPDMHIQAPSNLQSFNRYSYVGNNPVSMIDPSGNDIDLNPLDWPGDIANLGNDAIAAVTSAASTVINALSSAGSSIGNFFSQNGVLIGEIVGIAAVSILTGGVLDYALATGLGAVGAAVVSGAVAGAVAGALSSAVIGGHFSWQAVAVGALTGAVSGGISSGLGGAGAGNAMRIVAGAAAGGASQWLAGAVQGHASFGSFIQGAITGGVVSAAIVGIQYLTSGSETTAIQSGANRSLAGESGFIINPEDPEGSYAEGQAEEFVNATQKVLNATEGVAAAEATVAVVAETPTIAVEASLACAANPENCASFVTGVFEGYSGENAGQVGNSDSNWANWLGNQFGKLLPGAP